VFVAVRGLSGPDVGTAAALFALAYQLVGMPLLAVQTPAPAGIHPLRAASMRRVHPQRPALQAALALAKPVGGRGDGRGHADGHEDTTKSRDECCAKGTTASRADGSCTPDLLAAPEYAEGTHRLADRGHPAANDSRSHVAIACLLHGNQ
jgi:hypothetical protein